LGIEQSADVTPDPRQDAPTVLDMLIAAVDVAGEVDQQMHQLVRQDSQMPFIGHHHDRRCGPGFRQQARKVAAAKRERSRWTPSAVPVVAHVGYHSKVGFTRSARQVSDEPPERPQDGVGVVRRVGVCYLTCPAQA
jgi:hypothetical protein